MDGSTVVRMLDYAYDPGGRLVTASDPAASFDYTYDSLDRITSVTHQITGFAPTVVLSSAYDPLGNRVQLSATIDGIADFVSQYSYDAPGHMTGITQSVAAGGNAVAEKRIDLAYDAASQWQTITRYADLAGTKQVATSQYSYDGAGRLTGLDHVQGSTTLAGYAWQYDVASRVTQFTSLLDGTVDYTYDDTNQLTGADYDYSAGAGLPTAPPDETFTYDANGNRTISGYVAGPNNQLLSDGTHNYHYDAEGNRTRRTNIATGETTQYIWDYRDRLTVKAY